jgi:hypothetical protein
MEQHKFLCLKSDDELKALGYYKDPIKQIRAKDNGDLVCGVSGRRHQVYLIPCPQFIRSESGDLSVNVYFVDKQTVQDIQQLTKIEFRGLGKSGSSAFLERMAALGLQIALKKIEDKF